MPSISTRAGNISYTLQGQGQPIVMLHATLHDSHDFDTVAARLAKNYQTIAVDWPWHGDSEHLTNHDNLGAVGFADVLQDFVEKLSVPKAIFIGNSVGGFAAARLAITRPDLVRGLVLVNTGGFVDWNVLTRFFTRLLGFAAINRFIMPYLVRRYMSPQNANDEDITRKVVARAQTSEGAAVAAGLWRSFLDPGHDLRSRAKEIKVPVLLTWGSRDPIFPADAARATQRYIPGSRLDFLDAGHVVFSSKPEGVLKGRRAFYGVHSGFLSTAVLAKSAFSKTCVYVPSYTSIVDVVTLTQRGSMQQFPSDRSISRTSHRRSEACKSFVNLQG